MAEEIEGFEIEPGSGTLDIAGKTGAWGEAIEATQWEWIESGEEPWTLEEFTKRAKEVMSGVPSTAQREAENIEIAGIFLEQQQTIKSLDSILREKAAEPTTTGTLYVQQPPPGTTGTNFALLIGIGLGLWLLKKFM